MAQAIGAEWAPWDTPTTVAATAPEIPPLATFVAGEVGAEEPSLPLWVEADERPEHRNAVLSFHTEVCSKFKNGCCNFQSRGKTLPCFSYHQPSQRRRKPIDEVTGRLRYWDVLCTSMGKKSQCPNGDDCVFAHGQEEIAYHPAKYKTRRCNGRNCRGQSICCFAHSEAELRSACPQLYSYWAIAYGGRDAGGRSSGAQRSVVAGSPDAPAASSGGGRGGDAWPVAGDQLSSAARIGPQLAAAAFPPPVPTFGAAAAAGPRHKRRFCASFPDIGQCRRGDACAFAHSREEARTPLLSLEQEGQEPSAMTEQFFMYQFKTLWCPIGVTHDWQTCVYAHNYQDARRRVSIGYGPKPCPYWAKCKKDTGSDYNERCPYGLRCPYSHGAKEQLYHPMYFRTVTCRDLRTKTCPREKLCAFFHSNKSRRRAPPDHTNYLAPLKDMPEDWATDFLDPPFRESLVPGGAPVLTTPPGESSSSAVDHVGSGSIPGIMDFSGAMPGTGHLAASALQDPEALWSATLARYGLGEALLGAGVKESPQEDYGLSGLSRYFQEVQQDEDLDLEDFNRRLSMALSPPLLGAKGAGFGGAAGMPAPMPWQLEAAIRTRLFDPEPTPEASAAALRHALELQAALAAMTAPDLGMSLMPDRLRDWSAGSVGAVAGHKTPSTRCSSGAADDPDAPWKVKAVRPCQLSPYAHFGGTFPGAAAASLAEPEQPTPSPWTFNAGATSGFERLPSL